MLHRSRMHSYLLFFFLSFLLIEIIFIEPIGTVEEEETLIEGIFKNQLIFSTRKMFIYLFKKPSNKLVAISIFNCHSFSEFMICRHCGTDVTISNFFINKLSPHALSASNQTFNKHHKVLVQTLENSLGVQFKVAIVRKAHCAAVSFRVSCILRCPLKHSKKV